MLGSDNSWTSPIYANFLKSRDRNHVTIQWLCMQLRIIPAHAWDSVVCRGKASKGFDGASQVSTKGRARPCERDFGVLRLLWKNAEAGRKWCFRAIVVWTCMWWRSVFYEMFCDMAMYVSRGHNITLVFVASIVSHGYWKGMKWEGYMAGHTGHQACAVMWSPSALQDV